MTWSWGLSGSQHREVSSLGWLESNGLSTSELWPSTSPHLKKSRFQLDVLNKLSDVKMTLTHLLSQGYLNPWGHWAYGGLALLQNPQDPSQSYFVSKILLDQYSQKCQKVLYLELRTFGLSDSRLLSVKLFLSHLFLQITLGHMVVPSLLQNDFAFRQCLTELLTSTDCCLYQHQMDLPKICAQVMVYWVQTKVYDIAVSKNRNWMTEESIYSQSPYNTYSLGEV